MYVYNYIIEYLEFNPEVFVSLHFEWQLLHAKLALSQSTGTLPLKYTNVPPASIKSKEFTAPMVDSSIKSNAFQVFTAAKMAELNCLETVITAPRQEQVDEIDRISWSAYHASIQETVIPTTCCYQCTTATLLGKCTLSSYD